ncbi:hypothetical protein EBI00_12055 [Marinomonas hwangdonensis]|uniref:Uncharacterized protein n=1 Tax=Marinomonas hwangdonensis TaxID=1053647 RepID=A0A3M8Q3D3_9GAMM|nr:hypothetical protein EBI00_12055 [Marinomonas hwangdonensis]
MIWPFLSSIKAYFTSVIFLSPCSLTTKQMIQNNENHFPQLVKYSYKAYGLLLYNEIRNQNLTLVILLLILHNPLLKRDLAL